MQYGFPYLRVYFQIDYVGLDHSIKVPFSKQGEAAGWKVLRETKRVLQSYQEINMRHPVHINVLQMSNPSGSGRPSLHFPLEHNHEEYMKRFTTGNNSRLIATCDGKLDHLCLPKAFLLGWWYQKEDRAMYAELKRDHELLQDYAREMLVKCDITHNGPCGLDDVRKIQNIVNARLIVYDKQRLNAVIYCGPKFDKQGKAFDKTIHICLFDNHYTVIRAINAYMNCGYYCVECRVSESDII